MEKLIRISVFALFVLLVSAVHGQITQFRYENGVISSEGMMKDGKPDGYWKTYYPDGGLKTEGNRLNFKLDSTWKFYREDSTLERVITYREDLKNGTEKVFSSKEVLVEEFQNKNGIKNGEAKLYYDTGELRKVSQFINNKEEGKATEFEKDGRIITNLVYKNGFIYSEERINRYDLNGDRTGIWKDLYPSGIVKEEGNWRYGKRNGVFKFYDKKGALEKLEKYEDGVLVIDEASTAILDLRSDYYDSGKVKSTGPYREGKKQGNFREYDEQGVEIGGVLYDGDVRIGEGRIDSLGRRIGPWKLYYPDGALRAVGEYKEGLKEGPWQYYYADGKTEQKGIYKGDLPTGLWQWYFANGKLHREENYRKGKEDGHAVEYDENGAVIHEGDYTDGKKTGPWVLTINDHHEEGEYLDGERNGVWIWTYNDGQKAFQGEFQSGIPVNKHKYWYSNGQVYMAGSYEGGEMSGKWDYFSEIGLLELQVEFEAGQVIKINGTKIKLPEAPEEN
jgi:antitoxin component YwqK of YwqJK toxin-antitoxin module